MTRYHRHLAVRHPAPVAGTPFQMDIVWRVIYHPKQVLVDDWLREFRSLEHGKIGPRRYFKTDHDGLRLVRANLGTIISYNHALPGFMSFMKAVTAKLDSAISADNVAALVGFLVGGEPTVMLTAD